MSLLKLLRAVQFVDVKTSLTGGLHCSRWQAVVTRPIVTDSANLWLLLHWKVSDVLDFLDVVFKGLYFDKDPNPSFDHDSLKLDLCNLIHLWFLLLVDESVPSQSFHGFTFDLILVIRISLVFHGRFYDPESPICVQSLKNLRHELLIVLWSQEELGWLHGFLNPCLL